MTGLIARIEGQLARDVDPAIAAFAAHLAGQHDTQAVLFYGSNLRTGSLEGVLDFYVLTTGPQRERIWPRVSYHEWNFDGTPLRAKVAVMALSRFAEAASGTLRDTTIWARFVQPSALVWRKDDAARSAVVSAIGEAAQTAAWLAAALGPKQGVAEDYWRALFKATYKAEFRVEKAGREDSILSVNQQHFDGLLPLAWQAAGLKFSDEQGVLRPKLKRAIRDDILKWWKQRQWLGKPYNIMRLLKASTTFEGAARYAAWKIHRHTGVEVEVTPWREKHPVLAAPGVLWQVWREKAQRQG